MQLEVAGEHFLSWRRTLMQIKSRLLLPKHEQKEMRMRRARRRYDPPGGEGWLQQLVEYKRFQGSGDGIGGTHRPRPRLVFREYVPGPEDLPERELRPNRPHRALDSL